MNAPARSHPFEGRDNPFEANIVREPREAPPSAAGLNDAALTALVKAFAELETERASRAPGKLRKAKLVVSPDRGFGKTHLLGRLFAKLEGRASTIYLTPFQDPDKPWHSILRMTVDELARPLAGDGCQLQSLAIGVLARLAAECVADGDISNYPGIVRGADLLRRLAADPGMALPNKPDWIEWLIRPVTLKGLLGRLRRAGLSLDGRERAWLQVFAAAAGEARYGDTWSAAVKWLRAEALEPLEIERLRLDLADNDGNAESSPQQVNDLCFRRVRGFCALASLHRPFVFCFDQTEFFVGDKALIHTFGKCVWRLVDSLPNQLTIVTANQTDWTHKILPDIEMSHRDRISDELISLEGVAKSVAADVLRERLDRGDFGRQAVEEFFAGGWLDAEFSARAEFGVRDLLTRAARRFRELAKQPPPAPVTLEKLFDAELSKIRANPAAQSFDPDALLWFVKDLGPALAGVTVERTAGSKYFPLLWRWRDRRVCFAFEGGDNHKRWEAIAREASALARNDKGGFKAYVFRTPDLPRVPRSTWKVAATAIAAAEADGFRIVNLPADRVCEALAARELHSNALQGNIDFDGARTLGWLRTRFTHFLNELASAQSAETAKPAAGPAAKGPELDALAPEHERATLALVRESKIVDISVVLARIGGEARRGALLRFCAGHPNLKAHEGPKSTMLQWRL